MKRIFKRKSYIFYYWEKVTTFINYICRFETLLITSFLWVKLHMLAASCPYRSNFSFVFNRQKELNNNPPPFSTNIWIWQMSRINYIFVRKFYVWKIIDNTKVFRLNSIKRTKLKFTWHTILSNKLFYSYFVFWSYLVKICINWLNILSH